MKYFLSILSIFTLLSCETAKITEESEPENELTGKWVLDYMSPVSGKDIDGLFKIQKPYLTFVDDTKVAANNGCNNMAGEYKKDGKMIIFDTEKFRTTRMFCEGVDESAFPGILKTVNNYTIIDNGTKLMLLTGDIVSMTFVKVDE